MRGQGYFAGVVHPSPGPFPQGKGGRLGFISGEGDLFGDTGQDAVGVLQDIVVPEPDHAVAVGLDFQGAQVVRQAVGVLPTVAFYREAQAAAGKVDNRVADRVLRGELGAAELSSAQVRPKAALGVGHVSTQSFGHSGQSVRSQRRTPIPNPLPQGKGLRSL